MSVLELNKEMEEDILAQGNSGEASKKKCKDGKRFSDEQVKLLESIFEKDSKLEPRKKLELARELGLQPRQVAIWFQNRRARWKSKQIEHAYQVLKAEFDNLTCQFESLIKEKDSLLRQLQELNDQLENNHAGCSRSQDSIYSEMYTSSNNGGTELELKDKMPSCLNESLDHERFKEEDKDRAGTIEQFRWKEEPQEFWKVGELGDSSIASPENCCAVGLDGAFDLSCGKSEWWEF